MIVYLITNTINGKKYVGQTVFSLRARWHTHKYEASHNSPYYFHRAIRKYGSDNFSLNVLAICKSKEEMDAAEIFWIAKLQTFETGYNMTRGADGGEPNAEARLKISLKVRGVNHPFYGKKFSQETKDKMSESHRIRIAASGHNRSGTTSTPESRKKASDAVKAARAAKFWSTSKKVSTSRLI